MLDLLQVAIRRLTSSIVLTHARALLTRTPEGKATYLDADLRDPDSILSAPEFAETLDLTKPVALSVIATRPISMRPGQVAAQCATRWAANESNAQVRSDSLTSRQDSCKAELIVDLMLDNQRRHMEVPFGHLQLIDTDIFGTVPKQLRHTVGRR